MPICDYVELTQLVSAVYGNVKNSAAREAAAAIMGDVAKGRNPAAERKEAKAAAKAKRKRNEFTLRVLIDASESAAHDASHMR